MPVKREIRIILPVTCAETRPGCGPSKANVVYEPMDNGLIRVTDHNNQQLYYVEPKDLIELTVAVCSGVLVKMPDIQRQLRESLGLIERGDNSVEVAHGYNTD